MPYMQPFLQEAANLANHMIMKHSEDETQAEAEAQDGMTTPPATQTYAPASTPFCQDVQTPTPAVEVAAEKAASVSTSATQVESPTSVVPDYKQLYIDALLDQIETLKKTVKESARSDYISAVVICCHNTFHTSCSTIFQHKYCICQAT